MDNDKVFALYATILAGGVASIITASVMAGIAAVPGPVALLEHIALSFGFRAAYKSFGGWDWAEWSVTSSRPAEVTVPDGAEAAA